MRRFLVAAFAALAFAGLSAAPAAAGTHAGGRGAGSRADCTYHYDWTVVHGGSPQYAQADWETSCGLSMQVEAICYNTPSNTFYPRNSGVVTALETNDRATCYAGDSIESAWIRFDGGSWHRFWTR